MPILFCKLILVPIDLFSQAMQALNHNENNVMSNRILIEVLTRSFRKKTEEYFEKKQKDVPIRTYRRQLRAAIVIGLFAFLSAMILHLFKFESKF